MDYAERAGLRTHCQWQARAPSTLPPSAVPPNRLTDAPASLAPGLCGRCAAASPCAGAGSCHCRIMLMPASGCQWAGGCRFKLELGAWGTLPGPGPAGAAPVLTRNASSALLKGRKRAARSCAVVWLLVTITSGPSVRHRHDHERLHAATRACAGNPQSGHAHCTQGRSACSAACPLALPARRLGSIVA